MGSVLRTEATDEMQGFMKVLVDAETRLILGASILGTGGDEVIHCILDLMYAKATYTVMQRAVHIHPTVSELIPTMLGELRPLEVRESRVSGFTMLSTRSTGHVSSKMLSRSVLASRPVLFTVG